jgi:hypothetical protein
MKNRSADPKPTLGIINTRISLLNSRAGQHNNAKPNLPAYKLKENASPQASKGLGPLPALALQTKTVNPRLYRLHEEPFNRFQAHAWHHKH